MAKQLTDTTINFISSIKTENLKTFIGHIEDLIEIDDKVLFEIAQDHLLMYSIAGQTKGSIHSFKTFLCKSTDFFENINKLENKFKFVIEFSKTFVSILKHYVDFNENLSIKFIHDDTMCYKILLKNSKLKYDIKCADLRVMSQEIDLNQIEETTNKNNSNFNFILSESDFNKIKKLSGIEKDQKYLTLFIKDKKLSIGESSWNLDISDVEYEDDKLAFPKVFFNSINFEGQDNVIVYAFESFLLIKTEKSMLLITLELSV